MTNDGKSLAINLTDEQLKELKSIIEKPRVKSKDNDYLKVDLKNFSKKLLIKIIYDLKRQLDMYKVAGESEE